MRSLEIHAAGKSQAVPFANRQVLGQAHGLPEGALEFEPHREGAVLIGRTPGARIGDLDASPAAMTGRSSWS